MLTSAAVQEFGLWAACGLSHIFSIYVFVFLPCSLNSACSFHRDRFCRMQLNIPLQGNFDQCAPTSAAAAWEFGLWAAWGLFSQFVLCCPLDDPVGIIIITIISCDLWERTLQSDRAYTTFFSFSIDDIWENRKLPLYSQVAESLKIKGGQLPNQSITTRQGSQKLFLMPKQNNFYIYHWMLNGWYSSN